MTRKVLLVDDEKYICKGLKAIIERSETGFTVIAECTDGKEAFDKIAVEKFDLVILDIRMPNMDGITLIKEAQKLDFQPKFVILSGYDDFQYAVDALKYGAKAYLLKPVKREELMDTLKDIERDILKDEEINHVKSKMDTIINRFRLDELNLILLKDNLSRDEIRNILETLEINIFNHEFRIAVLVNWEPMLRHCETDLTQMLQHIHNFFLKTQTEVVHLLDIENNIVLITGKDADFHELVRFLRSQQEGDFRIGLSGIYDTIGDIRRAYLESREALRHRVVSSGEVIQFEDIKRLSNDFKIPVEMIGKISEMLGTSRKAEIEELLHEIFGNQALQSYHISYYEKTATMLYQSVINKYTVQIPPMTGSPGDFYGDLSEIHHFYSVAEYTRRLTGCILEINDYLMGLKDIYKDKNEIETAIQYIKENYDKNLSMAMVANHISLNYSYFSYLFKEQTGLSFIDYLTKIRIDKAKELLNTTEYKVYEIAEKVGYQNPKHFGKVFRHITGVTPAEYRAKPLLTASAGQGDR